MQTQGQGIFFKPGFTWLTASKPSYPGLIVSLAGGRYLVGPTVSGHLTEADSRDVDYKLRGGRRPAVRWIKEVT